MCHGKETQEIPKPPYPTTIVPEEPRTNTEQEPWRELTCARVKTYYDLDTGIALCKKCHEEKAQLVSRLRRITNTRCHFLYNNDMEFSKCYGCGKIIVKTRPSLNCPECMRQFLIYKREQTDRGNNVNELPNFLLYMGPSPPPLKLFKSHALYDESA